MPLFIFVRSLLTHCDVCYGSVPKGSWIQVVFNEPTGKGVRDKKGQVFKKTSLAFLQMRVSHKLWFRNLIDKVKKPFTGTYVPPCEVA